MGMFKKGFKAVREEKKRQDENREKMNNVLWRFYLPEDGDEADVRFLTEEPINFNEHVIKNRQGKYDNVICTADEGDCPYCDNGDRPQFKGAFLIYDKRPYEYTDKATNKKKKAKGQLRLYVGGTKILSQLDRLSTKNTLTKSDYTIIRTGSGTATSYMFQKGDNEKLSKQEIENMLPESLRDMYDGSMESLYEIVIKQLEYMVQGEDDDEDDDYEEDTKSSKNRKNLVDIDDDEDDEDSDDEVDYDDMSKSELYDLCVERGIRVKPGKSKDFYLDKLNEYDEENEDEDDDYEEEKPKKSLKSPSKKPTLASKPKPGIKGKKKPIEHSAKSVFKSKNKPRLRPPFEDDGDLPF